LAVPETLTEIPPDTPLSDRDLLIHLLQHVEDMHDRIEQAWTLIQPYVPILAKFAGGGQPDMMTIMQARRDLRRGHVQRS
jgi:hypothetical protein